MAEPILDKLELRRLPFQRRPIAQPGTTLVFQMADGQVVAPTHPYTTGETWWKGPKWAYVVDLRSYAASFTAEVPSAAAAVYFTATVTYTWSVHDAAALVTTGVIDPEVGCRAYLDRQLPPVTTQHTPLEVTRAERDLKDRLARHPIDLPSGIRIQGLHIQLRMDADQAALAKEQEIGKLRQELAERDARGEGRIKAIHQETDLELENVRGRVYLDAVQGGRATMMALVIAQNPDKAPQILDTMIGLSEREEQRTLEAIKILIDGGEIRLGELDGAVSAAVGRISAILGTGLPDKNKELPEAKHALPENPANEGSGS
jgi:hypothetical protein